MLVSVIVTTKNRYSLALRALKSVYTQNYPNIEVILVNDGDSYSFSEFEGLKVINNERSFGGSYSRNAGAAQATGEILCFLDDDDFWTEDKVSLQVEAFRSGGQDVGLVYTGRNVFHDDNVSDIKQVLIPKHRGVLYPDILENNVIGVTSTVAIKREYFEQVNGFDENLPCRQDYDLWIRLCKVCSVAYIKKPCVYYRISNQMGEQISNSHKNHITAYNILTEKYSQEFSLLGLQKERKAKSNLMFSVAKANRRCGYLDALPFIFRSLVLMPNVKALALLLPKIVLNRYSSL